MESTTNYEETNGTHDTAVSPSNGVPKITDPYLYINREMSWLAFNRRVLEEARDPTHPLLERVKFLAIFGTNLDEFYMIRVSGLQVQRATEVTTPALDGLAPVEVLAQVSHEVEAALAEAHAIWLDLQTLLHAENIESLHYDDLTEEEKRFAESYFHDEIFPILTPLAVDSGHPFPHVSNLSLNLAVLLRDTITGERFARVKVPNTLPRLVPLPSANKLRFVWIEEVIAQHIGTLFPGIEVGEVHPFRVTRNADIEIQVDEASDLLEKIEESIRERHFGFVTRLEVKPNLSPELLKLLTENLAMDARNTIVVTGEIGLSSLWQIVKADRPDLKDAPLVPRMPAVLSTGENIFNIVARQDVLLYHPYESFAPVIGMVETASHDEQVRAIKQTLYRVGPNSPLVPALIAARDADTQVAVLVELKARFDEENNIEWARRLEQAGIHVAYGMLELKTHCKVLMIVRREADGIKRYLHLGTGNYNAVTAKIYTDFGLLTSDPILGEDAAQLFNGLTTGLMRQDNFQKLLVAPINLRRKMGEMIERETEHARHGRPARLIFQMNALVDPEMIARLYIASQAGVRVDLIVRGVCCLRPGVPNVSENVTVISVVGRFLEHCRAYYFENGGDPVLYLGSADLMQRNLDRRVEVLFPVENPDLRGRVTGILTTLLSDNVQARCLNPDGVWERVQPANGRQKRINTQELFLSGSSSAIGATKRRGAVPTPTTKTGRAKQR